MKNINYLLKERDKGFLLISYILWPFSAVISGIKNFDSVFGRNLLIGAFVFLGYTSIESGDLERYASQYYEISEMSLSETLNLFINLEVGKLFNNIIAILFSPFNDHHLYFAFLFGFYGYFLVNSINMIRLQLLRKSNPSELIFFISFALFFSILTIFNYAFYTGAIYFVYMLLRIVLYNEKRAYFLILLTPIFHIGLTPLLLVPIFNLLFKYKTYIYVIILIICSSVSQTTISNNLELYLSGTSSDLDSKYNSYASERGIESSTERYSNAYESKGLNYRIFTDVRSYTRQYAIPLVFIAMFLNIRLIRKNKLVLNLFNVSIGCWSIAQLLLNISQGERFSIVSGFLVLGTFAFFVQNFGFKTFRFKSLIYISIFMVLLNNIVSLVLVKDLISSEFLYSNFIISFFKLL